MPSSGKRKTPGTGKPTKNATGGTDLGVGTLRYAMYTVIKLAKNEGRTDLRAEEIRDRTRNAKKVEEGYYDWSKSKTPLNSISATATTCRYFINHGNWRIALRDDLENNDDTCFMCGRESNLVQCDGNGCTNSFHPACASESDDIYRLTTWFCPECKAPGSTDAQRKAFKTGEFNPVIPTTERTQGSSKPTEMSKPVARPVARPTGRGRPPKERREPEVPEKPKTKLCEKPFLQKPAEAKSSAKPVEKAAHKAPEKLSGKKEARPGKPPGTGRPVGRPPKERKEAEATDKVRSKLF
ncbi:hypothetical protein CYMTET_43240 [Cymbomonas tetramitiformis]|uniref:PHD-type domain-containing protein n=1 Tax=Cymbomonas tetramitiformis TaxID=36881 RepID=A0AAE0C4N3_9CHLO|nr:hypothetical protein CYMTET_43240 [Cymbomonas tetramitiformis]